MKKIFSLLAVFMMAFFLMACDNAKTNDCEGNDCNPEPIQNVNEDDEQELDDIVSNAEFTAGDKGEGPFVVETAIASFTVPEGMTYEARSVYVSSNNTYATVEVRLTPVGVYQFGSITITNQGMIDSYEKAIEHTIKLQNLDTYKEGKYELLDEVEYNGIKYQTIKTSTEYGTRYLLAGYKGGWEISLLLPEDNKGFAIDDAKIKELMESLSIVPLN